MEIVDKIIDHVKTEISKNQKDVNEKLPELKRVFYISNQQVFVQKFTEAPENIKSGKSAFQYNIPNSSLTSVIDDFIEMIARRDQKIDVINGRSLFALYPRTNQKQIPIKGNSLWFGVGISDINDTVS